MSSVWISTLAKEYDSVISEMEACLRDCPKELWESSMWPVSKSDNFVWPVKRAGGSKPSQAKQESLLQIHSQFWNVAYHAIFHTDLYLSRGVVQGFKPPQPFLGKDHHGHVVPQRTYSRKELLSYITHIRKKAHKTIAPLTDDLANEPIAKRMGGGPFAELLIGNLGHMQGHLAQMNLFLSQEGVRRVSGNAVANSLRAGVSGKDDAAVDEFAESFGGYDNVVDLLFKSWVPRIRPLDCVVVHFDVGKSVTIKGAKGTAAIVRKRPEQVDLTVRVGDRDFLRWMAGDISLKDGTAEGRIVLDGDPEALRRLSPS